MQNYFNYFTEIEQRFSQRRGSILLLSTLDWALIDTWREAGIPIGAGLRGIDDAFDRHDARVRRSGSRIRKVNGLAWCAQSVMVAVEEMRQASVGAAQMPVPEKGESGFERERISNYLRGNADALEGADISPPAGDVVLQVAARLRQLAAETAVPPEPAGTLDTEDLERHLTVLEEKLFSALLLVVEEAQSVALREQAARELAPYRGRMAAVQVKQVTQQFLQKRLLEHYRLPRLSLFYMEMA